MDITRQIELLTNAAKRVSKQAAELMEAGEFATAAELAPELTDLNAWRQELTTERGPT